MEHIYFVIPTVLMIILWRWRYPSETQDDAPLPLSKG